MFFLPPGEVSLSAPRFYSVHSNSACLQSFQLSEMLDSNPGPLPQIKVSLSAPRFYSVHSNPYRFLNVLLVNTIRSDKGVPFSLMFFFASKRNKAKQKPFRFLFASFRETKKIFLAIFRFLSLHLLASCFSLHFFCFKCFLFRLASHFSLV